jgi:predicted ribosome quality control (RQC) complex YloA/Tae2 family protein
MLDGATVPRLDGARVTADDLRAGMLELLAVPGTRKRAARLGDLLASQVLGFSQDLGREVAARAANDPEAPLVAALPWDAIASVVRELAALPEAGVWQPTLVLAPGVGAESAAAIATVELVGDPIAYAVYAPRQYGDANLRAVPTVSAALAAYYRRAEWRDAVEGAKGDLRRTLTSQRDRCLRKADILADELANLSETDRLREEGDVLLAFQTEVPPRARTFTMEHPFVATTDGHAPMLTIVLDPQLTAVENANRRFARYHKLRRAAAAIPPQQAANALELARVEQLLTDLALADTTPEIVQVRAEVVEAGYLRGRRAGLDARGRKGGSGGSGGPGKPGKGKPGKPGKGKKPGGKGIPEGGAPLRRQSADGFALLVGKNSRQNEEVTFHQASGGDLWLHARGVPGAHVIVKSGGRPVPETTLRAAAALAAYYSQSRAAGSVPVDYTEQRYVRHLKGGGPGMVIYERERTLHVAPEDVA